VQLSRKKTVIRTICIVMMMRVAPVCAAKCTMEKIMLTESGLSAWRTNSSWEVVGDAFLHPRNENLLSTKEGKGVIVNRGRGNIGPLVSNKVFSDVRAHIEFAIPKASDSGVLFQGRYEIQIADSWAQQQSLFPGSECGGIYPRWDETRIIKPYDGQSPIENTSRPTGQWQCLDVVFRAPRFDDQNRKIENARFIEVKLNGTVIHKNVELTGPTRYSLNQDEAATGPIALQGDRGAIAFRNIWVASIDPDKHGLTNPFFAMDTATTDELHITAKSQVQLVKELGYAGIAYWERNPSKGPAGLGEMLNELDGQGLKVFGVYFSIKLEDPNEKYMPLISASIRLLAGRQTMIWLAITSDVNKPSVPAGDSQAVEIVSKIADIAYENNVTVALYPHVDFWLEKVQDAVRIAEKTNRRNVGVTFNLYHWLRTDNPRNMESVLNLAMPYLSVVTINGTTETGSIEPLDEGTFDVYEFLKALKKRGFKGPIGLQGYGIGGSAHENLKRSMTAWREFSQRLAVEEAENL